MKLDLLTNATVVDDAIRFVSESEKSKDKDGEQVKRSSYSSTSSSDSSLSECNNEESNEPDYEDENSDKEGEEKQKEQTGEITTTNKVF